MTFAQVFLDPHLLRATLPMILSGMVVTIELGAIVTASGMLAGIALAVLRAFGWRLATIPLVIAVDLLRSVPPLVLIVLLYFGLPAMGLGPSGFVCAWISLSLVLMAFVEEIVWAGLNAVPTGQWEAARSTGLGFARALAHVVLPQALRLVIPPLVNRTIAITKGTALASVVAVPEILSQATSATSANANPTPLVEGALAYLVIFLPVVVLGRQVERRWGLRR